MKSLIFNKPVLVFFLVCSALVWQIPSVLSETQNKSNESPLHVVSDKMIAQKDTSMVQFIGNVKATRDDSILLADSVEIYFNDDKKSKKAATQNKETKPEPQNNVKKIIATGNVEYTAGERKGFADKAVYTTQDETVVLTGKSPKLMTGSNFVTGKKITWYRIQDKVIVESDGTKRVEALFNPEDKITEKQ